MNDADKTALLDSSPIPSRSTLSRVTPLRSTSSGSEDAFAEGATDVGDHTLNSAMPPCWRIKTRWDLAYT